MSKMRSSSEVWRAISALEIADAEVCRDWASEIAAILPPEDLASGPKTIQALADKGYLTAFQAGIFQRGDAERELRAGRWILLEPVGQLQQSKPGSLWNQWFSAKDADGNLAWVRRISGGELEQLEPSQPSAERSRQLAKLVSDSLHRVWPVEVASGCLVAAVSPVEGELLVDMIASDKAQKKLPPAARWQLFRDLVEATAQLHRAGVVHGRIAPDRCVVQQGRCKLLIDPICQQTRAPVTHGGGILGTRLPSMLLEHFTAPEFLAPDAVPTKASDVFSLGSMWWWLFDGQPVSSSTTPESVMADQAGPLPEVTARISAWKQWTPEYEKCLQHALSRNVAARFADADKLLAAITAAELIKPESKTIARQKIPAQKPAKATPTKKETSPGRKAVLPPTADKKPPVEAPVPSTASSPPAVAEKTVPPASPKAPAKLPVAKDDASKISVQSGAKEAVNVTTDTASPEPSIEGVSVAGAPRSKSTKSSRSRRSRAKSNKWMLPVIGGSGFLIVLLAVLKLSGALEFTSTEQAAGPAPPYRPPVAQPDATPAEPTFAAAKQFNVVDSDAALWLPPDAPSPIPIDLLPPGGQLFISIRPGWLEVGSPIADALGSRLDPLRELLTRYGGLSLNAWRQATVAFYGPSVPGEFPGIAVRYQLTQPASVDQLASQWPGASVAIIDGQQFYASGDLLYFYKAAEDGSISEFSCGPVAQMQDSVKFRGEAGPMTPAVEQLWKLSDCESDFAALGAPQFLFTVGRALLERSPPRFADAVKRLLATDRRAALLQSRFTPDWYVETAIVGRGAASAANIVQELSDSVATWPQGVEQWFVDESPHAAWRAIALRYAPMLRAASSQLRHGVEDGVAKANLYLPAEAAPNLILAVWLASQPGATQMESGATVSTGESSPPLTEDQYLGREIRLSFAQEPIEVALQLVADEANDSLPAGTPPMRFELDGDAFELAGITRNQQLSDFSHSGSSVRDVLTDIARRGNPVTTVTDTREEDQQLIWVVRPDPNSSGRTMISLTTRTAAAKRGDTLPSEFAPASQ